MITWWYGDKRHMARAVIIRCFSRLRGDTRNLKTIERPPLIQTTEPRKLYAQEKDQPDEK
jgi:hypothetical protein